MSAGMAGEAAFDTTVDSCQPSSFDSSFLACSRELLGGFVLPRGGSCRPLLSALC